MVESPFTRAWVGYEVGIASQLNLPVVVIEPEANSVSLPVPGATVYLQRPDSANEAVGGAWSTLVNTGGDLKPYAWEEGDGTFWGGVLTFLANASHSSGDSSGNFYSVECESGTCKARFFAPNDLHRNKRHPCPSCRAEVAHFNVRAMEYLQAEAEKRKATGQD